MAIPAAKSWLSHLYHAFPLFPAAPFRDHRSRLSVNMLSGSSVWRSYRTDIVSVRSLLCSDPYTKIRHGHRNGHREQARDQNTISWRNSDSRKTSLETLAADFDDSRRLKTNDELAKSDVVISQIQYLDSQYFHTCRNISMCPDSGWYQIWDPSCI